MPGTYSQLLLHIVFGTKQRQSWITPDVANRLHPYMGGIDERYAFDGSSLTAAFPPPLRGGATS
jgi:hypothetical protein